MIKLIYLEDSDITILDLQFILIHKGNEFVCQIKLMIISQNMSNVTWFAIEYDIQSPVNCCLSFILIVALHKIWWCCYLFIILCNAWSEAFIKLECLLSFCRTSITYCYWHMIIYWMIKIIVWSCCKRVLHTLTGRMATESTDLDMHGWKL